MEKIQEHENIVAKILEHEITKIIAIVATVITVVNYIIIPIRLQGQELDNIKNNHLHTIQMDMNSVKALNAQDVKENGDQHRLIMDQLTKVSTILDEHLKNTK